MAILHTNYHSFLLFSKLTPTMLQNRALQYCTGLHFRHSSFGGRLDSFVDLNLTKNRVSCVSLVDYPRAIRLESRVISRSCLSRIEEPRGVSGIARSVGVLGNGLVPRGAVAKRFFCHISEGGTGKGGNFCFKDEKNSSFDVLNKHKKRAKGNQIAGYSSSSSRIAACEDVDSITSSIVEEVKKDVNGSTAKSKPKKQSGSRIRQKKSSDATASEAVEPKVSKGTATRKKNTKGAQSAQVSLELEGVAVQPKVSKTTSQKKKARVAQSNQLSAEPEKSTTDAVTEKLLDSSVPTPQQNKTKVKRKAKPKSKAVPSPKAEEPSVSSAIDLPQKETSQTSVKTKPRKQRVIKQLYPPTGKSVLVVESVTKAKVIQGYLGDMFEVIPSYGHVRDLAARSGSVRPDEDFSMVWEVPSAAWTHLKSIKVALSGAKNLILASDPDREGEAIAWHIIEMLEQQDALHDDINLARVVFNEITEASIKSALLAPRDIDANLVNSYLARRALDYLIGFNISPVLWRKLPGCRSAGRVQSAALSLICDREMEIDGFKPQEYWTVDVVFKEGGSSSPVDSNSISSYLTHFQSKKLSKLSISSQTKAIDIQGEIEASKFEVSNSKRSKMRKNPPPPYITSSLQQDAANKLNFPATYTMKLAQKLYEGVQLPDGVSAGLITYIRTDGLHISDEACKDICSLVRERYGESFASDGARKYFKKVKNAQEAHEAIRPTNILRMPSTLAGVLDEDSLKLYTLIWSRTLACQMEPAIYDQIQVDIGNASRSIIFRSSCSRTEFSGYQAAFEDVETRAIRNRDNEVNDRSDVSDVLSNLKAGDPLCLGKVDLKQHHTQPPPRFSEGSLVKTLEELGIGRPSTYASTMKVLQDRNYITVKSRILYPEFRGRMLAAFLSNHFSEVTDYSFTADMETELDNVSAGLTEWKGLLGDYWTRFSKYCESTSNVHIHEVEKMLEKTFGDFLFTSLPNKSRTCPSCREGTLIFKVSRFGVGYFIGCDQHPRCKYIAKTIHGGDDDDDDEVSSENHNLEEPKVLGVKPGTDEKILLKNGPYGYYVQLGVDRKGYLPKRASVNQVKDTSSITLEDALEMLRYPVTLGEHPEDGHPVILKLARFGFSIKHRRTVSPVPKNVKPDDISLEKALQILLSKDAKRSGRPKNKPKYEEIDAIEVM
ncbi:hypothetical protein ACET3Z_006347 [Daucus carota]